MSNSSRFFEPFFTGVHFIGHWFPAYFFGVIIIFSLVNLVYNITTNKKNGEYHKLNICCIITAILASIILYAIYW